MNSLLAESPHGKFWRIICKSARLVWHGSRRWWYSSQRGVYQAEQPFGMVRETNPIDIREHQTNLLCLLNFLSTGSQIHINTHITFAFYGMVPATSEFPLSFERPNLFLRLYSKIFPLRGIRELLRDLHSSSC